MDLEEEEKDEAEDISILDDDISILDEDVSILDEDIWEADIWEADIILEDPFDICEDILVEEHFCWDCAAWNPPCMCVTFRALLGSISLF